LIQNILSLSYTVHSVETFPLSKLILKKHFLLLKSQKFIIESTDVLMDDYFSLIWVIQTLISLYLLGQLFLYSIQLQVQLVNLPVLSLKLLFEDLLLLNKFDIADHGLVALFSQFDDYLVEQFISGGLAMFLLRQKHQEIFVHYESIPQIDDLIFKSVVLLDQNLKIIH